MNRWFVVHTQPQKEVLAAQELINQGFAVYYPKFSKIRRHARRVDTVASPLFPRYIFVNFDNSETPWRCINGTRGVSYLLTNDNKPISIPSQIIQNLKDQETDAGFVPVDALSVFTKGSKVRIVDGVLKDNSAIVDSISDQQRVQLLIDFMGRQLQVALPIHMVEAA